MKGGAPYGPLTWGGRCGADYPGPWPTYGSARVLKSHQEAANTTSQNLTPEIRVYNQPEIITYEASINTRFFSDTYLTMSNIDGSDFYNVKFQIKPFMLWIWFAALLTASGGLLRTFLKK